MSRQSKRPPAWSPDPYSSIGPPEIGDGALVISAQPELSGLSVVPPPSEPSLSDRVDEPPLPKATFSPEPVVEIDDQPPTASVGHYAMARAGSDDNVAPIRLTLAANQPSSPVPSRSGAKKPLSKKTVVFLSRKRRRQRLIRWVVVILVVVLGAAAAFFFWQYG